MQSTTLDLSADIIDARDIIARVEELETLVNEHNLSNGGSADSADDKEELAELRDILADIKGLGGDEQWRGDWYPITLIRDSHFRDYAEELAYDIGAVPQVALQWPMNCIDWGKAASELQWDYSSIDIDGVTYWTR